MIHSRRGLVNLILIIGLLLGGMYTIYLGYQLTDEYLEHKAKSSSEFTANELALLMDSIHSAPAGATFEYYTPVGEDGFPTIGSLELDTDRKELCIHPHSEAEIYSVISSQGMKTAGWIVAVYSVSAIREKISQHADNVAKKATEQALGVKMADELTTPAGKKISTLLTTTEFNNFVVDLAAKDQAVILGMTSRNSKTTQVFWQSMSNKAGQTQLRGVASADLKAAAKAAEKIGVTDPIEFMALRKTVKDCQGIPGCKKALSSKLGRRIGAALSDSKARVVFTKYIKSAKAVEVSKKIVAKLSLKSKALGASLKAVPFGKKLYNRMYKPAINYLRDFANRGKEQGLNLRIARKAASYITSKMPQSVQNRIANSAAIQAAKNQATKSTFRLATKGNILIGVFFIGSIEDEQFKWIAGELVVKKVATWMVGWLKYLSENAPAESASNNLASTIVGLPAAITLRLALVAENMPFATITNIQLQYFLLSVYKSSHSAADREEDLTTCRSYAGSSQEVLAYPPNCQPRIKMGAPEAEQEMRDMSEDMTPAWEGRWNDLKEDASDAWDSIKKAIKKITGLNPTGLSDAYRALRKGIDTLADVVQLAFTIIGDGASFIMRISGMQDRLSDQITKYTPHADCYMDDGKTHKIDPLTEVKSTGCDQTSLGQDCPNFYVSYPYRYDNVFIDTFIASSTVAPWGCLFGFITPGTSPVIGATACYLIALGPGIAGSFLANPGGVISYMTGAHIFPKKVKTQTVGGVEYNDNEGYYYMEFPGAIQFSKVYLPEEPEGKRSRVVITKG